MTSFNARVGSAGSYEPPEIILREINPKRRLWENGYSWLQVMANQKSVTKGVQSKSDATMARYSQEKGREVCQSLG